MPSKILITGGTGLVGAKLTHALQARNYEVVILTTSAIRAEQSDAFYWNLKDKYIDHRAFEGVDYIIHLAGAAVADGRWTTERRKLIYNSRIENTKLLHERSKGQGIKGIIAASGIGYYGRDTGDEWMDENCSQGNDFLANVVGDWEQSIDLFSETMEKVVALRIGVVLSPDGGALKEMSPPFKLGLGAAVGTGRQWMSWIHINDLIAMMLFSMDNSLSGTFNAVAPHPATNKDFSKALAGAMEKPFWVPKVPGIFLKMVFGEMASVVLGGNRVKGDKIQKAGFSFEYSEIKAALTDLVKK